ncbi:hypothetical protein ebA3360 [Aromatoleum aromaticum EbN1]|uniref:Uncharacterized protein n=1 Tax=Aromatoleum aromaticum (strain DSM 19018 / LMG 30748 / EbN1) TaxID=76114 RepID=Q5P3T9_AROAE|nr:hypothetical protein ebA3360 [Aromatoleum aromaticum EbN1]
MGARPAAARKSGHGPARLGAPSRRADPAAVVGAGDRRCLVRCGRLAAPRVAAVPAVDGSGQAATLRAGRIRRPVNPPRARRRSPEGLSPELCQTPRTDDATIQAA